jgi:hypothetical protein
LPELTPLKPPNGDLGGSGKKKIVPFIHIRDRFTDAGKQELPRLPFSIAARLFDEWSKLSNFRHQTF